jgi:hypothetical protein
VCWGEALPEYPSSEGLANAPGPAGVFRAIATGTVFRLAIRDCEASICPATMQPDFDSSGLGDILWRNSSGTLFGWLDGDSSGTPIGDQPGTDWSIAATNDFNADDISDILWRHVTGTLKIWFLRSKLEPQSCPTQNSVCVASQGFPGALGTDWSIAGVGDFNSDLKADILWRHTSGVLSQWFMDGTNVIGTGSPGTADTSWAVNRVGDFIGDGKSDILWRNTSGVLYVWLMNGSTVIGRGSPGAAGQ